MRQEKNHGGGQETYKGTITSWNKRQRRWVIRKKLERRKFHDTIVDSWHANFQPRV